MSQAAGMAAAARQPRRVRLVFGALMLVLLLAALDQTIVATALPTIVADLGTVSKLSWVVTAYLLASTVVGPLYGKLGDLYGRKTVSAGSVAAGRSRSPGRRSWRSAWRCCRACRSARRPGSPPPTCSWWDSGSGW